MLMTLCPKTAKAQLVLLVQVDFKNQFSRTRTVHKNLNPIWNQKLLFHFDKTQNHHHQSIARSLFTIRGELFQE